MDTLDLSAQIKAPIERVWWAFTTADGAKQWGAEPAKFDAIDGGEFSYWDGDIHGINTKVVPMQTLEQDWYGHDHPEEKYRAEFSFTQVGDTTTVKLHYSGHLYDKQRDITDWQEYYFDPIKKLLEA
ncbi:MAG: SRPBCC domain-containing protein [Candidatus Saccharibacteria bacterium]